MYMLKGQSHELLNFGFFIKHSPQATDPDPKIYSQIVPCWYCNVKLSGIIDTIESKFSCVSTCKWLCIYMHVIVYLCVRACALWGYWPTFLQKSSDPINLACPVTKLTMKWAQLSPPRQASNNCQSSVACGDTDEGSGPWMFYWTESKATCRPHRNPTKGL